MLKRQKYRFTRFLERAILGMLLLNGLLAAFIDSGKHDMKDNNMAQVTSNCETGCDDVEIEEDNK